MKALETVKLVELTIVVAIETYGTDQHGVCPMDYITASHDAEIVGWSERTLSVKYKDEMETAK
jgi:hypothetical protein